MAIFDEDDLVRLSAPHVCRAWFASIDLPSGLRRLHTGIGPVSIGGHVWDGVSDPFGGQLVSLSPVEEPRFGTAASVEIVLSGANRAFLKSVWDDRDAIEGASCELSFATFDQEGGEVIVPLATLFRGRLTAPRFEWRGLAVRAVAVKVVSKFEGLNFAASLSAWSPAGQRQRFPGDRGMDFVGSPIVTVFR